MSLSQSECAMNAHLVRGSVGGMPIQGGSISLDSAGSADVINATTGLVREIAGDALLFGIGLSVLNAIVSGDERREAAKKKELEEKTRKENEAQARIELAKRAARIMCEQKAMNTWVDHHLKESLRPYKADVLEDFHIEANKHDLLPLSGVCRVKSDLELFNGICLNKELNFECRGETRSIDIRFVRGIIGVTHREHPCELLAIDGSRFAISKFNNDLIFMTVAGPIRANTENVNYIRGLNLAELERIRELLMPTLRDFRREAVECIGEDLVQKYFRLEPISPKTEPCAAPTGPAPKWVPLPKYLPPSLPRTGT